MKKIERLIRENCSEEDLVKAIQCTPNAKNYIRLCAIYDLMNGYNQKFIFVKSKIKKRTLQFWIQQFIKKGIDGLVSKPNPGRPKILDKKH